MKPAESTTIRVAEYVAQSDGVTVQEVAAALGMSLKYAKINLIHARKAGSIDYVQVSRECLWARPELMPELIRRRELAAQAADKRRIEREVIRGKRRKESGFWRRSNRYPQGVIHDYPKQSNVAADAPLPFLLQSPNSVFELRGFV